MENKYWNRPYSKRLYDLTQASIDKVNYDNEVYEKSLSKDKKKYRDIMQGRKNNGKV